MYRRARSWLACLSSLHGSTLRLRAAMRSPAVRRADYLGADGKGLIPGWSARAYELDRSAARRKRRRPVLRSLRLFALIDISARVVERAYPP
jgi:hypothetical protein